MRLGSLIRNLKKAKNENTAEALKEILPAKQISADFPFTRYDTIGAIYSRGPVLEFVDESRGIRKTLVDADGTLVSFPGFEKGDWMRSLTSEKELTPSVYYGIRISRKGTNGYKVLWEVQPDGMYWMDEDGFGMTNDEEVCLYTYLDDQGDYTAPFRIHHVGSRRYDTEEEAGGRKRG